MTSDSGLRTSEDLDALDFDSDGLVPVVAQDAGSGAVLMLAWANREALERALATGSMHYWSRSRDALWRKGETSGHTQEVLSLHADCDGDAVLARVRQSGPACHTGRPTCFGHGADLSAAGALQQPGSELEATARESGGVPSAVRSHPLEELWGVLEERARSGGRGSYTTRLLADENLRIKKLGEETAELILALARGDRTATAEEAADLLYHVLVALLGADLTLDEVLQVLAARRNRVSDDG